MRYAIHGLFAMVPYMALFTALSDGALRTGPTLSVSVPVRLR